MTKHTQVCGTGGIYIYIYFKNAKTGQALTPRVRLESVFCKLLLLLTLRNLLSVIDVLIFECKRYFESETDKFLKNSMFPVWRATSDYEDARIAYDANRLSYESLKDTESSKLCGLSSSHLFFKKTPPNRGKGGSVLFGCVFLGY